MHDVRWRYNIILFHKSLDKWELSPQVQDKLKTPEFVQVQTIRTGGHQGHLLTQCPPLRGEKGIPQGHAHTCPGHTEPVESSPDFLVNQCLLPTSGKDPASRPNCPDLWSVPQTFQLKITPNVLFSKHPQARWESHGSKSPVLYCTTKELLPFPEFPQGGSPRQSIQMPSPTIVPSSVNKLVFK